MTAAAVHTCMAVPQLLWSGRSSSSGGLQAPSVLSSPGRQLQRLSVGHSVAPLQPVAAVAPARAAASVLAPPRLGSAQFADELAAAATAVRLASQLCQVRPMCDPRAPDAHAHLLLTTSRTHPAGAHKQQQQAGAGRSVLPDACSAQRQPRSLSWWVILPDGSPSSRLWLACAGGRAQNVQRQLSQAEKTDKKDDSPVTVADYGARLRAPGGSSNRHRGCTCTCVPGIIIA